MRTTRKWSRGLALLAAPIALAAAGLVLPATAAWAWNDTVVIAVQPTTTQVGTAMTPAVVVQVDQSGGQVDQSYNGPVTLTYAVNPVGAPEPAGNSVNAVNGVATFSGLTFPAVGFGFKLQAEISGNITSQPSGWFNIVTQLVRCSQGQTCQTGTVSSAATSGSVAATSTQTSNVLTVTGGGFPALSCTSFSGVISFSVDSGASIVTATLDKSAGQSQSARSGNWKRPKRFNICWGSQTPFTTLNGTTSVFNTANNEYEGLLPFCRADHGSQPCILHQHQTGHRDRHRGRHGDKNRDRDDSGEVVTTIAAPAGDPRFTY